MPSILLLDTNNECLLELVDNLQNQGYEVITTTGGTQGIQAALSFHPQMVICCTDMLLPVGVEFKHAMDTAPETAEIPFMFLPALGQLM